jgi:protein-S-isoprenylcysteine O-methyltransferase Ste14
MRRGVAVTDERKGSEIALGLLGAGTLLFGLEVGTWWAAHQLAWWTFAVAMGGGWVGYIFVKELARAAWKDRKKRKSARVLAAKLLAAEAKRKAEAQ